MLSPSFDAPFHLKSRFFMGKWLFWPENALRHIARLDGWLTDLEIYLIHLFFWKLWWASWWNPKTSLSIREIYPNEKYSREWLLVSPSITLKEVMFATAWRLDGSTSKYQTRDVSKTPNNSWNESLPLGIKWSYLRGAIRRRVESRRRLLVS